MKYIKRFAQHADYEAYMGGGEVYLPNVCICGDEPNVVHYNPYQEQPEPIIPENEIWYFASRKLPETTNTGYGVEGIHTGAFDRRNLVSHTFDATTNKGVLTFSGGLEIIGEFAFWGCREMYSIVFPDNVFSIGGETFSLCYSLREINLPTRITHLKYAAFDRCPLITTITIPISVVSIENNVFLDCESLSTFNYEGTISQFLGIIGSEGYGNDKILGGTKVDYIHCSDGDLDASPYKQSCC